MRIRARMRAIKEKIREIAEVGFTPKQFYAFLALFFAVGLAYMKLMFNLIYRRSK